MPVFFLTLDNCDFAKQALRSRLPQIKSSHLTEALAAAFGYRTHAALLAAIGHSDEHRPVLAQVHPAQWSMRLQELGYGSADPNSVIEMARSPGAPIVAWREFAEKDQAANNRWFRECKKRNIPNVYVELRKKYAKLTWDNISIDADGETHLTGDRGDELSRTLFKCYQAIARGDPAKSTFFGSAFVGTVDRLSLPVARDLADEFFMRFYTPMGLHTPS